MVRDTNNDLFTPTNLGTIRSFSTFRESISQIDDLNDFYTFNLVDTSNVSFTLSGLSSNARLDLIKNANNSRFGDPGETIKTLNASGFSGTMSVAGLGAGQYALRVAEGTTPYELTISPTAGAGPHQESLDSSGGTNMEILNSNRLFSGSLNGTSDQEDFYRFFVGVPTKVEMIYTSPTRAPVNHRFSTATDPNGLGGSFSSFFDPGLVVRRYDNLLPDNYTLKTFAISQSVPDLNYNLSFSAKPIVRSQLSVLVEQVTTNGSFGIADTPDFFVKATIDGVTKQTRTVDNRKTVDFNETLTQPVNINKRLIPITLNVIDSDGGVRGDGDEADINSARGTRSFSLTYDVLRSSLIAPDGTVLRQEENDLVTITGNGDDDKATTLKFRINYDSFAFGEAPLSSNTPTNIGTNASQSLTGQPGLSGLFDGRSGRDRISMLDGDDIALGGAGNAIIDGGTGDDILFGGLGRDTLIGGKGSDTFVLAPATGVDVIKDFRNGVDKLGLTNAIAFEMLEITQTGRNTAIGMGGERLAVLKGVRVNQIGTEDFVAIDFSSFKGMDVPIVA